VSQLNGLYVVRNSMIRRKFLQVKLLECYFQFITYQHIPRQFNHISDAYEHYVLDWHLRHNH